MQTLSCSPRRIDAVQHSERCTGKTMPQSKQNPAPRLCPESERDTGPIVRPEGQPKEQPEGQPEIRHAASAAIFNTHGVLLVRRGRPPLAGRWSLPGGHLLPGELHAAAAIREVHEETSIPATIIARVGLHTVKALSDDGRERHYHIEVHVGLAPNGAEPTAGDDACEARFVALNELNRYALTNGAAELIAKAARQLRSAGQFPGAHPSSAQTAGSAGMNCK